MGNLSTILNTMWTSYLQLTPQAQKIYDLFTQEEESIINDHIALRTFRHPLLGINKMAKIFIEQGYEPKGEYTFPEKKLYARHYEHSQSHYPKIFISELLKDQLSSKSQAIIEHLIQQVSPTFYEREDLPWAGRPWQIRWAEYQDLAQESEYAAWVAAHGFQPNHFTISVNHLIKYNSIEKVNDLLTRHGFILNLQGGAIKGSPQVYLEQSSTMAEKIPVKFEEGFYNIPSCYYEFAKRYPLPNGMLYQGFVEKSADKIFESTHLY